MTTQNSPLHPDHKPTSRIGGSILPSSDASILRSQTGAHGTLQVRPLPELDTYGLFLGENNLLAMHPNGYSCHALLQRVLLAWDGKETASHAMEQFDYILRCGGLGRSREEIEHVARGLPDA